jgi:hypothetical protein
MFVVVKISTGNFIEKKSLIRVLYKECPDERKNIRSLQYLEAEVLD